MAACEGGGRGCYVCVAREGGGGRSAAWGGADWLVAGGELFLVAEL